MADLPPTDFGPRDHDHSGSLGGGESLSPSVLNNVHLVTDDSELQEAFNSVEANDAIFVPAETTINREGNLPLNAENVTLIGESRETSRINFTVSGRSELISTDTDGLTVANLTLVGPGRGDGRMVRSFNANSVTIENCEVRDAGSIFSCEDNATETSDHLVRNVRADNIATIGQTQNTVNVTVEDVRATNVSNEGVDPGGTRESVIQNVHIQADDSLAAGSGEEAIDANGMRDGCVFRDVWIYAEGVLGSVRVETTADASPHNTTLENVYVKDCAGTAFRIRGPDEVLEGVVVRGCTAESPGNNGFTISDAEVELVDPFVSGASGNAIFGISEASLTVRGGRLEGVDTEHTIFFDGRSDLVANRIVDDSKIIGTVVDGGQRGISLNDTHTEVIGATVKNTQEYGIRVDGRSSGLSAGTKVLGGEIENCGLGGTFSGIAPLDDEIVISGVEVRENTDYGIKVPAGSTGCRIRDYVASGNTNGPIDDSGTRTRINGVGAESADAEEPTAADWSVGDVVDFMDTGDGSGDGVYQLLPDGTWTQIGA